MTNKASNDTKKEIKEQVMAIEKTVELKPCPFCGGDATSERMPADKEYPEYAWRIKCEGCRDERVYPYVLGRDEADCMKRWNTRKGE